MNNTQTTSSIFEAQLNRLQFHELCAQADLHIDADAATSGP